MDLGCRRRDERVDTRLRYGAHREERDGIGDVDALVEQALGEFLALGLHVRA